MIFHSFSIFLFALVLLLTVSYCIIHSKNVGNVIPSYLSLIKRFVFLQLDVEHKIVGSF